MKQRLAAAAEEIFELLERTITEYEEELMCLREKSHRPHAPAENDLSLSEGPYPSVGVSERGPGLLQDPQPCHIKEEQEEDGSSQEETLRSGIIGFTYSPVKSEDDPELTLAVKREDEAPPQNSHTEPKDLWPQPVSDNDSSCFFDESDEDSSSARSRNAALAPESLTLTRRRIFGTISPAVRKNSKSGLNRLSCPECYKVFPTNSLLERHVKVHTGERPFSCSVCGSAFNRKSTLENHMTMHTGVRPFSCGICQKGFCSRSNLSVHMVTHTGEKPFSCSQCDKTFNRKSTLKTHMTGHTGEKPFRCSFCGKQYAHKHNLRFHLAHHLSQSSSLGPIPYSSTLSQDV